MNDRIEYVRDAAAALFSDEPPRRARIAAAPTEGDAESCASFGFLRGLTDRAVSLEFRFRNGNREAYPYALFAGWRFDASCGALLKFTLDVTVLVLLRGSNLDVPVNQGAVDLFQRGLGGQRVIWIKEMDEEEIRRAGLKEPTIDRIEVGECESQEDVREWLKTRAAAFCRE